MKLEFSRQIFEKVSNIKFHQNPSSGNMTKLIVAFRNFANAPNIYTFENWMCSHSNVTYVCSAGSDTRGIYKLLVE